MDTHDRVRLKLLLTLIILDALKQAAHVGNHGNAADFPILGAGDGVAQDGDFALVEIAVPAVHARGLALSATAVGEKPDEIGALPPPTRHRIYGRSQ